MWDNKRDIHKIEKQYPIFIIKRIKIVGRYVHVNKAGKIKKIQIPKVTKKKNKVTKIYY